jgi:hypothetical protein
LQKQSPVSYTSVRYAKELWKKRRSYTKAELAMLSSCQTELNTEAKSSGKDEIFKKSGRKKLKCDFENDYVKPLLRQLFL